MRRLTKKMCNGEYLHGEASHYSTEICLEKLGQLEDLMEKYKIDNADVLDQILSAYFKTVNTILEKPNLLKSIEELSNIEQELGIGLLTLLKALKNTCYIKLKDNRVIETINGSIEDNCEYIYFNVNGKDYQNRYDIETICLATKDYGKTWALTKEEL